MTCEKCELKTKAPQEKWYQRTWRPMAAFVYLIICIFDFIIMPTYLEVNAKNFDMPAYVELVRTLESDAVQSKMLTAVPTQRERWEPITLGGAGTFHLAFGAVLGVSAYTRNKEKQL